MPKSKAFKATVQPWGNSCGIKLPFHPADVFGKARNPVNATINNAHTYRTTTCAMHNAHWIPLNKANRLAAGVEPGDSITVKLTLDEKPRTVTPPDDLLKAIRRTKGAKAAWDKLSYTNRREWAESIRSAKRSETRARRINKCISALTSP